MRCGYETKTCSTQISFVLCVFPPTLKEYNNWNREWCKNIWTRKNLVIDYTANVFVVKTTMWTSYLFLSGTTDALFTRDCGMICVILTKVQQGCWNFFYDLSTWNRQDFKIKGQLEFFSVVLMLSKWETTIWCLRHLLYCYYYVSIALF